MPEVPPSVTNYGVSEASDAQGLEHTYMPSSPHSQSFHSQSAIMCLHTSLAIITSCSVITHPGPDITCPPMSSPWVSSHRVHSDVPRFKTKYAPISALVLVHAKYEGADFLLDSHPISAPTCPHNSFATFVAHNFEFSTNISTRIHQVLDLLAHC